ncbi:hypothetical protein THJ036_10200 [Campylobacter jejuni]|nr:hypothetical protein THJ036_10200 [Campylobacter jejuni]GKY19367.1 hypothetical protein THJ053_10080 [Campylobacter jejuni]
MQNLLLYIKNNLTPTLAQILLQALKIRIMKNFLPLFWKILKQFALGSILTNLGIDIYQQNILIHL